MNGEVSKSEREKAEGGELEGEELKEQTEAREERDERAAAGEDGDEPEAAEDVEANEIEMLSARLKEAESARQAAERQVEEYADRFRKAQAQLQRETDDLRLRLKRNFEQQLEKARGDLVGSLLETLDNLKRAIAAADTSERGAADFSALLEGVRATAELFESRMRALGLEPLESVGTEFNPEVHEAVEVVAVGSEDDNRVVEELQPGYKFGDRLLRPARVRVGRAG